MRQSDNDKGTFEQLGESIGGLAGRMAGQATDMTMNVVGSIFGAAVDTLGQWWSSPAAEQAGRSFGEEQDRSCRQHFDRTTGSTGTRSYDSIRPLYQFGHVARQNPDYRGRGFREVEPELERAWTEAQTTRYGPWPEVRSYVGFGYDPSEGIPV
ncbi:MAG TPA: hypothetical protein VHG28_22800 [Longimicrobiaceae bacterium]|nr:hypothetical protein [Longimicrobiaceae bacterium]